MEITGIPCDHEFRRATGLKIHDEIARLRYEMRQYLGWSNFNPMSDDQRREALFSKRYKGAPWNLGLKSTQRTKKAKKESTGYKAIIDHLEHPFVKMLTTYIELTHVYSTVYRDGTLTNMNGQQEEAGAYSECMSSDGRFHPKWTNVKKTTRFGSTPNFQNMRGKGKPDRKIIRAPDGWKIIASDKDQLELRLLAALCGVPELVNVMMTGGDPHRLSATKIYGDRFINGSPARQKDLRDISKNVTYACVYLAQLMTVWRTVRERKQLDIRTRALMTLPTVEHARNTFLEAFHQIPEWHEENMALVKNQGFLEGGPLGRRRFFPVQPPSLNEVANWPIQMRGAEYVTMAMCYIQHEFKRKFLGEASAIMHCHDEIVALVKDEHVDEACKIINYHFNNQWIEGPLGKVRLTADVNVGQTYYDAKFVKKAV
jgi:DNA polymerase-1